MSAKEKIKKILFTVSIIIALFFTLQIIGKKIVLPFPTKREFSNLTTADIVDNKKSLIADSQGTDLVFLNENKEVDSIINLGGAEKLSRVKDIVCDDKYFYVLGDKLFRNSIHIEYERVMRYTLDGKNPTIVYEETKEKRSCVSNIRDIDVRNGAIYITKVCDIDDSENAISKVYKINLNDENFESVEILSAKTPYVYDAKYLCDENFLYISDYFGHLSRIKDGNVEPLDFAKYKTVHPFIPIDGDTCIYLDFSDTKMYKNEQVILENVVATYFNLADNKLIYDNQYNSSINIYDISRNENVEYKYATFSMTFFILTLLRFISVIYIVALVIYLIVKALYNKYKEKNFDFLKKLGLISVATVTIIFISIFYENKHIETYAKLLGNNIKIMNDFFAQTIDSVSFSNIDLMKKETLFDENTEEKNKYNDYYGLWTGLSNTYDNYTYIALYKKQYDKNILIYDSTGLSQYNIELKEQDFLNNKKSDGVQIFSFAGTKTYYINKDIKDSDGKTIGSIEMGVDYESFNSQAITECFEMSMSLLTIFVAIYLLIVEGMALVKGFSERKKNIDIDKNCSEIHLTHSLIFFQSLIRGFDSIILVLITKDMVRALGYPVELENYLITLPVLALGLGSIVGPVLYVFLAKRFDVRKCLISSSVIIVFAYAMITYAVSINNFIIFCMTMIIISITNVLVYTGISIIPYRTDIEEKRYVATHEKSIGKMSASIFGALVGGVVVQYFGNVSLYVVNTIACIPIVILLFIVLPKNTFYIKNEKNIKVTEVTKKYFKYIFSIPMLSFIIFILGPTMISGGYKTYVFPLFTSAMNMPKMYITNFYVFARIITMIVSDPIVKATKKIDYWNLEIYCVIAIGLSFMTFGINTTVLWAIIMLVINSLIDKISIPTKAMLWPRHAEALGLNIAETQTLMALLEKVVFSLKEVAFAALLTFGNSKACVIFGVISLIFAMLFAIITKNSTMAKNNK